MYSSQIADFDILRVLAFGSISATYAKIGTALTHSTRLFCVSNNTDGDMVVTWTNGSTPASDGTADKLFVPAGGFKLIDVSTNKNQLDSAFLLLIGDQFWVRYLSAPSKNSVYLETMYGVGE